MNVIFQTRSRSYTRYIVLAAPDSGLTASFRYKSDKKTPQAVVEGGSPERSEESTARSRTTDSSNREGRDTTIITDHRLAIQ